MPDNSIKSISDLRPGDIGFGPIDGAAGVLVALGQLLLGDEARFRHAFVVVWGEESIRPYRDIPMCVEAMPSGARRVSMEGRWTNRYVYIRPRYTGQLMADMVAGEANWLVGTPYSFLDYLALALRRWGINHPRLRQRITDSGHMICSQLVDQALTRAGVCVFNDGRLSQDVTPGALFYQLLRNGGSASWPG